MATALSGGGDGSTTAVLDSEQPLLSPENEGGAEVVRLKLRKPRSRKKVSWTNDTVDNEHLNKKKSKCCCVYVKPKPFGDSSSDTDDECEHCSGHVEKKQQNKDGGSPTGEEEPPEEK